MGAGREYTHHGSRAGVYHHVKEAGITHHVREAGVTHHVREAGITTIAGREMYTPRYTHRERCTP